jgi:hypothetical protein
MNTKGLALVLLATALLMGAGLQSEPRDTAAKTQNYYSESSQPAKPTPIGHDQPRTETPANPREHETYNYYGNFNFIPPTTPTAKTKDFWVSNKDAIAGLSAILLAIFTGGLWLTSIWQWRAIGRQANIADKTLMLQFRPQLIVRNVVLTSVTEQPSGETYMLRRGYPVMGQFYVANVGDSPARITESFCMIEWRKGGLPMRRPYEGENGNNPVGGILNAGETRTGVFTSERPLDVDPLEIFNTLAVGHLRQYDLALYVMGWVEYADDLGFVRRTAFCRWLNPMRNYFMVVDNPDYEHAE